MVFHLGMDKGLDIYEKRFCAALKEWYEKNYDTSKWGSQRNLAEFLGISQPQDSKILRSQKCWRSERERRKIAKKIGIPYEKMIKAEKAPQKKEAPLGHGALESPPKRTEMRRNTSSKRVTELLNMTREILESETTYSESLAANVRSFHRAIQMENKMEKLEVENKAINDKLDALHRELALFKSSAEGSGCEPEEKVQKKPAGQDALDNI